MSWRLVAAFCSSLLLPTVAASQCNLAPVYSGAFRLSALDVAVDGNDLWVAAAYGVQLYDRSVDPPALITTLPLPGVTRIVRTSGGVAYAGSGSTLYVLKHSGRSIQRVASLAIGGTINDLLLLPPYAYVAASNGISQISLDPTGPRIGASPAAFGNAGTNVLSLANSGSSLYAADGDSTIDIYSISQPAAPVKIGSVTSLPRSISVRRAGDSLYVSDGQNLDVFSGSGTALIKLATYPYGGTSLVSNGTLFVAGTDRHVRALNVNRAASPVLVYDTELRATSGTINRVSGLALGGSSLYVAGGDAGLASFRISDFIPPFPVSDFATGATSSIVGAGGGYVASTTTGGLVELTQASTGEVTLSRSWDAGGGQTPRDSSTGLLLSSAGSHVTLWSLTGITPSNVGSATFRTTVTAAVLIDSTAYVLLGDQTLWSVNLAQASPAPAQISTDGAAPSYLSRSGRNVVLADLVADGTTIVRFYANASFGVAPVRMTIEGAPTTPLALNGSTAALFTFRGLTTIDFSGAIPIARVFPLSTRNIARGLRFSDAGTLYELTPDGVIVWDVSSRTMLRQLSLPSPGSWIAVAEGSAYLGVATADGVASIAQQTTSKQPLLTSTFPSYAFYKKIVANSSHLYLFDGQRVDIYGTSSGNAPHYERSAQDASGVIDLAAADDALYTLSSSGVVTRLSPAGFVVAQRVAQSGADVVPLALATAGNALWFSYASGCLSGGCTKTTLVLDPKTLAQTTSMNGGVIDVTTVGARAYALFDLPSEVRVLDISDALHPAPAATRATEGQSTPVAIGYGNGVVYVAADKVYAYNETALTKLNESTGAYDPVAAAGNVYVDQRLRIDGTCALVTGRTFDPQFFNASSSGQWSLLSSFAAPAAVRSIASQPGRIWLLTDDSLELLASTNAIIGVPHPRPTSR
jgi:hypothetical protein